MTNDDGFGAPGLAALFAAVRQLGTVHVVAPMAEQSGCSHRLTLRRGLAVHRRHHELYGSCFVLDGTPADCVRLALAELIAEPIDLVVAGINLGANAGVDTYYSGTIAAAREGAIQGVHSISVSQAVRNGVETNWEATSKVAATLIRQLADEPLPGPGFWSVNFPAPLPAEPLRAVHRVPLAQAKMPATFDRLGHPSDGVLEFVSGAYYWDRAVDGACDYGVIRDGGIAVTAIPLFGKF
ncbi:MAG TPA: 5'/3'-nucleotidase SurE [Phycisphaerae bacterium]|nr:5'/3'-nucleotidase SurE [Phycisphaerae bacterium]HNU46622.1 5'/3'-nucleotidase SurE [Phycisphaerae bacterium]